MPEKALAINGVTRLVWVESHTDDTWAAAEHQYRRIGVILRRSYFEGNQYDEDNLEKKQECFPGVAAAELVSMRLPEHMRKHAYSSHVREGVTFLSDQVTGEMQISVDAEKAQVWMDAFLEESNFETRKQEVAREILIAGDMFARLRPQPLRALLEPDSPAVKVEWWQAEDVEVDYDEDDWEKMTEVRFYRIKHEPDVSGEVQEVKYTHQFRMQLVVNSLGVVVSEAVERIFREDDEEPSQVIRLGLPFIPWVHLHGEGENMRSKWGRPVVSGQLMETAARYDATCQLEFLAVRYNSFGNLAVVGDAAHLAIEGGAVTRKDIADIVSFPGSTGVHDITLNINVAAFKQTKDTLVDEMYDLMGLTRMDDQTLRDSGDMSGYALEILNRKTDGTFRALVDNLEEGLIDLLNMAFDVDAYARAIPVEGDSDEVLSEYAFWDVDPEKEWPDRDFTIDFGTAYIVDEVALREDYVAGVLSRREVLRKRGYDDETIEKIMQEIEDEGAAEEARLSASLSQGTRMSTGRG